MRRVDLRSRETRFAGMPRRGCHIRRSRCSRLLFRRGAAQASAVNVNVDDTHYNTIAPAYSYFLLADVDSALGCGSSRVDTSSPRRIFTHTNEKPPKRSLLDKVYNRRARLPGKAVERSSSIYYSPATQQHIILVRRTRHHTSHPASRHRSYHHGAQQSSTR
jgi:hypothetical protein